MANGDIPLWWIGLSLAVLLVSIVIGTLVLAAFNLTANSWVLPVFNGCLSGGISILLLIPVLHRSHKGSAASPPLVGKS